ncbi:non-ribosomal peptide synthetase/type I polyketide synthase [Streptomyces sp. ICBB 8177]|uniref:non-ribosomal peptide synthetase/type I polyketide synthase n=1 Tax=Streptomyces sp. ICBB 8177 TaxID=563922 RepID=UPI000D6798D9|nr:non-ribosomal peptide synthetase/type I polyketide synthase [Streptomyces sp. ICBB 8177]PWI45003.1 non-ribosomal peptide synthetase [Streptomyces sp. ICBB 8177]
MTNDILDDGGTPATAVAVVGMALRCPGAQTLDAFWQNLSDGVESITTFTDGELLAAGVDPDESGRPDYVRRLGVLSDMEGFDAAFFGFSRREAEMLDPQHRLLLECAWEALEHAGSAPGSPEKVTGVYAGVGESAYLHRNLLPNGDLVARVGEFQTSLGNDKDFVPTRVSFKLDLRGPSVSVQTGCSTSLVAVHMACQALNSGECDVALAGGATVIPQRRGYRHEEGGIRSADGRCRAFDAAADGTVAGSGAAVVALKRLDDALADGDVIHAVIRGSAVNNDGARKVGFTAPSVEGQADVITEALAIADVDPSTVSYIEAHGTGTPLGDPVEVAALKSVFGTVPARSCALGSVKTNIGHLDTAAGAIGLIKVVLSLRARKLPPSLHFTEPNPRLGLDDSPFHVNTVLVPWEGERLRAGVSSFGIGGTNAHVVLEEAPARTPAAGGRARHVLPVSAATPTALATAVDRLTAHLRANPDQRIDEVAYTLQRGRRTLAHRGFVVAGGVGEAVAALGSGVPARHRTSQDREVVFGFPGQGAQRAGMGRAAYEREPVFRAEADRVAALLRSLTDGAVDVRPVLGLDGAVCDDEATVHRTSVAQPALFVVEYALARLWESWGVRPVAMVGHSLGELVAACVAGVMSLEDALRLVAVRGRLMQSAPAGVMTAVPLPESEVVALLDGVDLAAVNGPRECVVSGTADAITAFEARLAGRGVVSKRLRTSHAFHSRLMDGAAAAFEEEAARVRLSPPCIPFVSDVTGEWITDEEATSPGYWARQIRATVRFHDALTAVRDTGAVLLEAGPGQVLTRLARAVGGDAVACLPAATATDGPELLSAVGELWCEGVAVDWEALAGGVRPHRTVLPTYPFERERCWIDPPLADAAGCRCGSGSGQSPAEEPAAREPEETGAPDYQDQTEREVAAVFADLLGARAIGPEDGFFELGGHSLLATQLVSRVRGLFGVDIPLRTFIESPTIRGLARALADAGAESGADAPGALPAVVPDPDAIAEPFPLTDVQQAYWIGRTGVFDIGNVGMHGYEEFEVTGLDLPRLELAFRRLIRRHGMLRAIVLPGGEQQILTEVPDYVIAAQDVRGRPEDEARAALEATRDAMSHQVFAPEQWPLFELRATLLDGERTRLHYSIDGLITDARSSNLLLRELADLYRDPDLDLPELQLSFRDYVLAEQSLEQTESYRRARAYWCERVPDFAPAPELPLAREPRTIDAPRFSRVSGTVDEERWSRLKAVAARRGITPTALTITAYGEALATWATHRRFTLNLPMANRLPLHPGVDAVVGDFTSVTLLEVDATGTGSFGERARAVRDQLLTDIDHRLFSGVRVLREIKKVRPDAAMPAVFTSLFLDHGQETGLGREVFSISQTPQVWIDAQVFESEGSLVLDIDAVDELFPEGLVASVHGATLDLLRRLADDEERWDRPLPSLLPATDAAVREDYNRTAGHLPSGLLHEPFFAVAERSPDRPAVITRARTLSYGELAGRAGVIAARLTALDVRPNDLVAVVMEKGWEQSAAVLGILASGAAYLPVDAELPEERIHFLLTQGQVRAVLTQSWVAGRLAGPLGPEDTVLAVDTLPADAGTQPVARPATQPGDLAYVIFTSGSTGVPKGVMISHRGALNTVIDVNDRFAVGEHDRTLALSSLSFDLSVYDIFGPLAAGGAVVVPDPASHRDPAVWLELAERAGVTLWNSVPALMELLVEHMTVGGAHSDALRLVMLSGDWFPVTLPERIRRVLGTPQIVSLGGATEASIWSILHLVGEVPAHWPSIPYGRPMRNQAFHVLDEAFRPRPTGVPGQLYIGGVGLAEGYLRDEERTAASFVRHPVTGERLYRTGDLGRFLPSGEIEFLGREDFQVKLQGYRIELGEIETALLQHPAVRGAAAVVHGRPQGAKRLVAFVVPQEGDRVPSGIREFLGAKLPGYMVPETVVGIPELPLTANGKVDRKALVVPDEPDEPTVYEAPATEIEKIVAAVWENILKVERIGRRDHFFELGGDSLTAMRTVVRLRKALGVEIPIRVIFDNPTLERIAAAIGSSDDSSPSRPVSGPVRTDHGAAPVPLTAAQARLWFHDQLVPGSTTYNLVQPFRLTGPLDATALRGAFEAFVDRHDVLSLSFEAAGDAPHQMPGTGKPLDFQLIDVSDAPEQLAPERVIAEEARAPFDLASGPHFRVRLLRVAPQEHVLVVSVHHIVWDAWSTSVMVREISALYRDGNAALLPEPGVCYADVALWEAEQARSGEFRHQIDFWRRELAAPLPVLALPTEGTVDDSEVIEGARAPLSVGPAVAAGFREVCTAERATTFMGYLAAWKVLLQWWCRQQDIVVGVPAGHRAHPQLENTIGFLVNSLAIRTRFTGDPTFTDVLKEVREKALEAYANQDVPFDHVVQAVRPERRSGESAPVYRTWFLLEDVPLPDWDLPGVRAEEIDAEFLLSVHDIKLTLVADEEGGMTGGIDYRVGLFSDSTVRRLTHCLSELVKFLSTRPDARLSLVNRTLEDLWEGKEGSQKKRSWNEIRSQRRPQENRGTTNA